jgi:methenyltetrahydrofolate cyclohydrolase
LNHLPTNSVLDLTVRELLERLGSSEPTPGGGAAAAVVGSLGAALVEMTANLTLGRRRFADVEGTAKHIEQRAADLRQRLAALGDADAAAFEKVSAAYRLPRASDAEKAARTQAIQSALLVAAGVPLETARLCADVLALAEQAAPILNPSVISDVLVGALLARAGLDSAAVNVEINLAAMTDPISVERFSKQLGETTAGVAEQVERILAAGRSRFPGN